MQHVPDEAGPVSSSVATAQDEEALRKLAIQQLGRKRRFIAHTITLAAVNALLVVIWAITEYNNAGGWPTDGFSQSSSIPHVWNIWIIYPVIGSALILGIHGWSVYRGRKPLTESEVRQEMDRLAGPR